MNEEEFAELSAGHALRALSAEDEARYLAALRAHPEWEAVAERDAATAAGLADGVPPVSPDVAVREALLARIAQTPQFPPAESDVAVAEDAAVRGAERGGDAGQDRPETPAPRSRSRLLFALAACLVLLVGLGFGANALRDQLAPPGTLIALEQVQAADDAREESVSLGSGATVTAHWSAGLGTAVLVAEGLEQLPPAETYQLWFVRDGVPLPAGLLEPDAVEATAVLEGRMHSGDVIAVTVEPAGGSPTGQPTSDPIVVIPTA